MFHNIPYANLWYGPAMLRWRSGGHPPGSSRPVRALDAALRRLALRDETSASLAADINPQPVHRDGQAIA